MQTERVGGSSKGRPGKARGVEQGQAVQTPFCAYIFSGKRFDVGDRLCFVEATIEYALRREDLAEDLSAYLRKLVQDGSLFR